MKIGRKFEVSRFRGKKLTKLNLTENSAPKKCDRMNFKAREESIYLHEISLGKRTSKFLVLNRICFKMEKNYSIKYMLKRNSFATNHSIIKRKDILKKLPNLTAPMYCYKHIDYFWIHPTELRRAFFNENFTMKCCFILPPPRPLLPHPQRI